MGLQHRDVPKGYIEKSQKDSEYVPAPQNYPHKIYVYQITNFRTKIEITDAILAIKTGDVLEWKIDDVPFLDNSQINCLFQNNGVKPEFQDNDLATRFFSVSYPSLTTSTRLPNDSVYIFSLTSLDGLSSDEIYEKEIFLMSRNDYAYSQVEGNKVPEYEYSLASFNPYSFKTTEGAVAKINIVTFQTIPYNTRYVKHTFELINSISSIQFKDEYGIIVPVQIFTDRDEEGNPTSANIKNLEFTENNSPANIITTPNNWNFYFGFWRLNNGKYTFQNDTIAQYIFQKAVYSVLQNVAIDFPNKEIGSNSRYFDFPVTKSDVFLDGDFYENLPTQFNYGYWDVVEGRYINIEKEYRTNEGSGSTGVVYKQYKAENWEEIKNTLNAMFISNDGSNGDLSLIGKQPDNYRSWENKFSFENDNAFKHQDYILADESLVWTPSGMTDAKRISFNDIFDNISPIEIIKLLDDFFSSTININGVSYAEKYPETLINQDKPQNVREYDSSKVTDRSFLQIMPLSFSEQEDLISHSVYKNKNINYKRTDGLGNHPVEAKFQLPDETTYKIAEVPMEYFQRQYEGVPSNFEITFDLKTGIDLSAIDIYLAGGGIIKTEFFDSSFKYTRTPRIDISPFTTKAGSTRIGMRFGNVSPTKRGIGIAKEIKATAIKEVKSFFAKK